MIVTLLTEHHLEFFKLKSRLQRLVRVYTCKNVKLLEISCHDSIHCDTGSCLGSQCEIMIVYVFNYQYVTIIDGAFY